MDENKKYLRPNVVAVPLVDSWYAWSHLISPATFAMNIVGRHFKIMDSYINAPKIHEAAANNEKMLGGPFMDYKTSRVEEIQKLKEETQKKRGPLISLASAIKELDTLLINEAKGESLDSLYEKVPEPLKGYVELVYDLNNRPSFRLIEALFYQSKYYDHSAQSLVLSTISTDDRPFMLSTPVLRNENSLELNIPFKNSAIDSLFRLKEEPQTLEYIKQTLQIKKEDESLLDSFLTDEKPQRYEPFKKEGLRWRYFGHACVLLETSNTSILVDPILSYTYESQISRYTYQDLPEKIDCILITHAHQDHILFETLLQLRHKTKTIVIPRNKSGALQDPSLKLMLKAIGFNNIIDVDVTDELTLNQDVTIKCLPFLGEHADLDIQSKMIYLLEIESKSILFATDSCFVEPRINELVSKIYGDIDIMFLGMECDGAPLSWLYGPLLTKPLTRGMDQSRRLSGSNATQGFQMIECFKCREVYVYAMGQEPWIKYISSKNYTEESLPIVESDKLIRLCHEKGIVAERLFGEKEIILDEVTR